MTDKAALATAPVPGAAVGSDPWWIFPARLVGRRDEVEGVITLEMELLDPDVRARYRFLPGQFNMLYVHGVGECPISIASPSAHPERLSHTIRMVGQVTDALARQPVGSLIGLRGPFGSFWPVESARGRNLILVAGGIGLPPLRPVIEAAMARRRDFDRIVLVYGAKTVSDLLYTEAYETWREAGIETLITVDRADDRWRGERGLVPTVLKKLRLRGEGHVVFTCGPDAMMKFVVHECLASQIPESQVFVSLERNMVCAIGFCGHCQFGPDFICKDGPVLSYARVKRFFWQHGF